MLSVLRGSGVNHTLRGKMYSVDDLRPLRYEVKNTSNVTLEAFPAPASSEVAQSRRGEREGRLFTCLLGADVLFSKQRKVYAFGKSRARL